MLNVNKLSGSILFLSALFVTSVSSIAEELTLSTITIDGLHQRDGTGLYDQVMNEAAKAAGDTLKLKTFAPKSLWKFFNSKKLSCVSPANTDKNFYRFAFPTIQSTPFFQAKIFIYTKSGSQPIADLSGLKGKRVGIRNSMDYGNKIDKAGLTMKVARTIEKNIERLEAGEIDAFIAYWPDSDAAFKAKGMEPLPHASTPVNFHDDAVLCRDNEEGQKMIEQINKGIKTIKENGKLDKILG